MVVVLVVAGVLVAVFARREREPEYGGKRLSEWVEEYSTSRSVVSVDAIGHIGTNALPYLLKWIRYKAPPWKAKMLEAASSALQTINGKWGFADWRELRGYRAVRAFRALGSAAAAAIPELTDMIEGRVEIGERAFAVDALLNLGSAGLPAVATVLTNRANWLSPPIYSVHRLGRLGTNARPAVPALQFLLTDPDPRIRDGATNALRQIEASASERVVGE